MVRWYAQLDPEERSKQTIMKILSFLLEDKEVSWSELEKKAKEEGMSKASLSKHLKSLSELGLVERRVDASTYPPHTYYKKKDEPRVKRAIPKNLGESFRELLFDNTIPFDFKLFQIEVVLGLIKNAFSLILDSLFRGKMDEKMQKILEEEGKKTPKTYFKTVTFEELQKTCNDVIQAIVDFTLTLDPEKKQKVHDLFVKEIVLISLGGHMKAIKRSIERGILPKEDFGFLLKIISEAEEKESSI